MIFSSTYRTLSWSGQKLLNGWGAHKLYKVALCGLVLCGKVQMVLTNVTRSSEMLV